MVFCCVNWPVTVVKACTHRLNFERQGKNKKGVKKKGKNKAGKS